VKKSYLTVSPLWFVTLSVLTMGIYELYWGYRYWCYVKERDASAIRPFWRALFLPLWCYALLKDIAIQHPSRWLPREAACALLAVLYFALNMLWRLPDPYWLISSLSFLPLLPAVFVLRKNAHAHPVPRSHSLKWGIPATLLTGPLAIVTGLSAFNLTPSSVVISGDRLWSHQVELLREHGVLEPDETIVYFYSTGLVSIKEDGQFLSDCCVVSYWPDTNSDELLMAYAFLENIEDYRVHWSDGILEDTIVTITTLDGYEFDVWLSPEQGGDKTFISELEKRWEAARNTPGLSPHSI